MHGIWGYQILDSSVSFYIWSWFYGPFFFMAHGTWPCVLPFNWSPNSGQLVDEASRGPLDPIFIVILILMTCVASFSEFLDWFTFEMQKEFCENNKWMPPRMNVGADPFSCLRPSNLTGISIFNTNKHLEDLKILKSQQILWHLISFFVLCLSCITFIWKKSKKVFNPPQEQFSLTQINFLVLPRI